jgi:hypothetical protein
MAKQYSAGSFGDLQYFIGVVEDRNDPNKMGRIRVRAYGIHPDNKEDVSTEQLPWAIPIMPYTSASTSGVGLSPTGPVEGTWVFGFFVDGKEFGQPMILGTLPGAPTDPSKPDFGFNDPNGIYPIIDTPGESDVNALARGEDIVEKKLDINTRSGEDTLDAKIIYRQLDVAKAVPPRMKSTKDGAPVGKDPSTYWNRETWNEPNPRYGGQVYGQKDPYNLFDVRSKQAKPEYGTESKYPLNHVNVSESGHVFEVDDSPKAGRIHQYHHSGTFTEIQPNGTRVTKIIGDDYQVVLCDKNMMVNGNVNITVNQSDLRLYVNKDKKTQKGGDIYFECDGDFNLNVKGDMMTKIQGSEHKEVITDSSTQINGKSAYRVTKDMNTIIDGSNQLNVRGDEKGTIQCKRDYTIFNNDSLKVLKKTLIKSTNDISIVSSNNINVKSTSNTNIQTSDNLNIDATTKVDIDANGNIELTTPAIVDIDGTSEVDIDGAKINLN